MFGSFALELHATTCIEQVVDAKEWTGSYTKAPSRLDNAMSSSGYNSEMMYLEGCSVYLSAGMAKYIREEAASRGVSELAIYEEEKRAERRLAEITPPNSAITTSPPATSWYDED